MEIVRLAKRYAHAAFRFFERRDFRNRIREEKSKKYLVSAAPKKTGNPLSRELTGRGRFRFASTVYAKLRSESERLRTVSVAVAVVLIALSGYLFFGSPYFRIAPSHVIIERLDSGSDVNIAYKSVEDFYGTPIFLVNASEVSKAIVAMQKNIRTAQVTRLYPNGLKIVLSSWSPEFVTYFPDLERYYGVTSNGILVYERSRNPELPAIDIVDPDLSEAGFLEYREGIAEDSMVRILELKKAIKETLPGVTVAKYAFFRLEQELHVFLDSGVRLVFALDGTEKRQLGTLAFWNSGEAGALAKGGISYLDLRIGAKMFVCREEAVCKKNLIRIYGDYYRK